jgi:hypothetical protein
LYSGSISYRYSIPSWGEGEGLLIVGAVDPQAAVLRLHVGCYVPQQLLVLAEDLGGALDLIA